MRRLLICLLIAMGSMGSMGSQAFAACKLEQLAQFPITMVDLRPTLTAKINGTDVVLFVDSGAFWSVLSPATAQELNLRLGPALFGLEFMGAGGQASYHTATAQLDLGPLHRQTEFIVGGNQVGGGAQGLIGQNILRSADLEYNLANGMIRWARPQGCGRAALAYWAHANPFSEIDIEATTVGDPHTRGIAYLNGKKIHVLFDTGAPLSLLTLSAAERAGVKPGDPGVVANGYTGGGVGRKVVRSWIAPFASFKLGDEEIRHTHLRIADFDVSGNLSDIDMLVGADFFLAHHVYVATSQNRMYFTYNGGPVFNLTAYLPDALRRKDANVGSNAPSAAAPPSAAGGTTNANSDDAPKDAEGWSRLGAALAARGDFSSAVADFTRASQLDPTDGRYFEQRGMAEWRLGQSRQALADFDQALTLKPDAVPARMARVQLLFELHDRQATMTDLQALDAKLPKEADERSFLATAYLRLENYAAVIRQDGFWLNAHPEDVAVAAVLNQRCWARALLGQELPEAVKDCDASIRRAPTVELRSAALDSRGLVHLRMGDYVKSIDDYNAALKIRPRIATSLYGRGIAEQHRGQGAAAQGDQQAAQALQPGIADQFRHMGVTPQ